jgi:hypothetical protein
MDLAIHYLKVIGCQASGLVSDEDLVNAVRSETSARDYDGVILAAGRLSAIPEVLLVTRRQPWAGPGRGGIQHLIG